jgi:hypothetical protein
MKYFLLLNALAMMTIWTSEQPETLWMQTFHTHPDDAARAVAILNTTRLSGSLFDFSDRIYYHINRVPQLTEDLQKIRRAHSVCREQLGDKNNSCLLIGQIIHNMDFLEQQIKKTKK